LFAGKPFYMGTGVVACDWVRNTHGEPAKPGTPKLHQRDLCSDD